MAKRENDGRNTARKSQKLPRHGYVSENGHVVHRATETTRFAGWEIFFNVKIRAYNYRNLVEFAHSLREADKKRANFGNMYRLYKVRVPDNRGIRVETSMYTI